MSAPVFLGSELFAAAYRLAGARAYAPEPAAAPALFDTLVAAHPPLVLLGESCIAHVGVARVYAAVSTADPPVLVITDRPGPSAADVLAADILAELGIA